MDAVLNELSIEPCAGVDSDDRLRDLAGAVRALLEQGMSRVVRHTRDALERRIDADATFRRRLFGLATLREEKQFLARLLDRQPFVEDLARDGESQSLAEARLIEHTFCGHAAEGLAIAHLHDVPAVSLRGHERFGEPRLAMSVAELRGDDYVEREVDLVHVSLVSHVAAHRGWLEERIQRAARDGSELWARRAELFPRLDLCANTERQLRGLFGSEPHFMELIRHLHVLSRTASEWTSGPFDPPLRWSNESETVRSSPVLRSQRTFTCPDGEARELFLHTKLNYGGKRIHFWPDAQRRRVIVGHIGDHLETARF
jgi:hypothetical protein